MLNLLNRFLFLFAVFLLAELHSATAMAQGLRVTLTDADGSPVDGAVVEILLPPELSARYAGTTDTVIDQVDKEFVPAVTAIVKGSKVSFPNSDDILHHVYSFSPVNTFDIPLYGNDTTSRFVEAFPDAGIVEIGCNIHDWMLAYIYVADSAKVAVSDESGTAAIGDLPPGTYSVRIWHARLPRATEFVMTSATLASDATAELTVTLELERDRRIRRAPSANRTRYR